MKKNRTIFLIATSIILLWEGAMPLATLLFAPQYSTTGTQALGYPDYFAYALIICKVLAVLAIALPRVPGKAKEWAYAGLTFNLVFAAFSHAAVDGNFGFVTLPVIFLIILGISYFYNPKIRKNEKVRESESRVATSRQQLQNQF